jgi:stearoyl-CoA desaturase (delta-9 desaturase)
MMDLNKFSRQIYKYRVLYFLGATSVIVSVYYAIEYGAWLLLLASYLWSRWVGFLGNQIALHKYFTHKSFTTTALKHKFLLWFSILGGEGSPITWASHHRHHHKYADTEQDIHSPHESVFLSTVGWQLKSANWWLIERQVRTIPKELLRDKSIKFVDKHYYNIWAALILISFLINWKFCVFFILAPIGHGIISGAIGNLLGHWKIPGSYRNFETDDKTYNNQLIAYYLGGEGLHNNHHHDSSKYDQAVKPGEVDLGGIFIRKFFATN